MNIQWDALKENIGINSPFYFILFICLYLLSNRSIYSYVSTILSFIAITFLGYFSHIISHQFDFTAIYNKSSILSKDIPYLDKIVRYVLDIYDFHHKTHHDTTVNRTTRNLLLEALNNIFIQGILFIIIGTIYNYLNKTVFILWGLLYASFHIINYSIIDSSIHTDHHLNIHSNYGIDIYDIIMGTKHDWNDIEEYNHYAINLILLTIFILLFRYFVK